MTENIFKSDEHRERWFRKTAESWQKMHRVIFNNTTPAYFEWTNPEAIVKVLHKLGRIPHISTLYFADGGGNDLEGASMSREPGCIELNTGFVNIMRPKKLTFYSIDPCQEWSYFRLEAADLLPTGLNKTSKKDYYEEVCELKPLQYISDKYWTLDLYNGKPLPKMARSVVRHFKGSFVLFKKTSVYSMDRTKAGDAYNAHHERLGEKGFYEYILNRCNGLKN